MKKVFALTLFSLVSGFVTIGSFYTQPLWASEPTTTGNPAKSDAGDVTVPKGYDITQVAGTKVSIDVHDANVFQVLDAITQATNEPKTILVNSVPIDAQRLLISLKVKNLPLGDALRMVAAFCHCGFYMLPGKFVIAPYRMLSEQDRKRIIQPTYEAADPPTEKVEKPEK